MNVNVPNMAKRKGMMNFRLFFMGLFVYECCDWVSDYIKVFEIVKYISDGNKFSKMNLIHVVSRIE